MEEVTWIKGTVYTPQSGEYYVAKEVIYKRIFGKEGEEQCRCVITKI